MKHEIGFRGELRPVLGGFRREYRLLLLLALGLSAGVQPALAGPPDTALAVSSVTIGPVVNYRSGFLRLGDFKDKLLVLDFWATYCGPCRLLLPRYDSLQRLFGGRLQVLLVSHEQQALVAGFLRRSGYGLPSVAEDTVLARLFPHNSIPHEVWILRGRVVAVTDGSELNAGSVARVLSGKAVSLRPKLLTRFDEERPLYADGNGRTLLPPSDTLAGAIIYQSMLTRYNPGLNMVAGIERGPRYINVFALNGSPLSMYHLAFRELDPLLDLSNRFLLEVPDSLREALGDRPLVSLAWEQRYGLCYNLALPLGFKGDVGQAMVNDLNRFFSAYYGVEARLEDRPLDCLVLRVRPGRQLPVGSSKLPPLFHSDTSATELSGLPVSQLVVRLAYLYRKLATPLVDATGYDGPVAIYLAGNMADRAQLDRALVLNGLQLLLERRVIPMVVLRCVPAVAVSINSSSNLKP
jgi:thiol-disulfide isomerase/thioredoxin